MTREELGAKIKLLRQAKGLSVVALSELTGYNKGTISNIENAKFSPRMEIVDNVLSALGATLEIRVSGIVVE